MKRFIIPSLMLAIGLFLIASPISAQTPDWGITVSSDKTTYALGEVITITGRATTTVGQAPVTDASITVSLVRVTGTGTINLGTVPVNSTSGNYTLSSAPLSSASGIQEVSYRITVNATSPTHPGQVSTTAAIQVTSGTAATGSGTSTTGTSTKQATGTVKLPNPISCNDATCLISQIVRYVLGIIAVIATLMFVWGGVMMLTSGGNADQVKRAKETLTWAAIGVIVIMLSWVIIKAVLQALTKTGS